MKLYNRYCRKCENLLKCDSGAVYRCPACDSETQLMSDDLLELNPPSFPLRVVYTSDGGSHISDSNGRGIADMDGGIDGACAAIFIVNVVNEIVSKGDSEVLKSSILKSAEGVEFRFPPLASTFLDRHHQLLIGG